MGDIISLINSQSLFVHIVAGISLAFYIVLFIFGGIGISKIANDRGIKGAKTAFIPILQHIMIGKIADDIIDSRNKLGKPSKKKFQYSTFYPLLSLLNPLNFVNSWVGIAMHLYLPQEVDPWYLSIAKPYMPHMYSIALGVVEVLLFVLFISMIKEIFDEYSRENTSACVMLSVFLKVHPFLFFLIRNNKPYEYKYTKFDDEYYENFNDFKTTIDG